VPELRARLWQRELVDRLIRAGGDEPDLHDWIAELRAEEDAVQLEYRNLGVVYAQLSQVEAGVRSLARTLDGPAGNRSRSKKLTFDQHIKVLENAFLPRFFAELKALKDVRHLRNQFAHGEVRVGMASIGPSGPLDPVISLVHSEIDLPDDVHHADPLRDVTDLDLDVYRAMEVASEGLDALTQIMIATDFSPFSEGPEP